MQKEKNAPTRTRDIIQSLATTPVFMAKLAQTPEAQDEKSIPRIAVALGATASHFVEHHKAQRGSDYLDDVHQELNLVSLVPSAAQGWMVLSAPKYTYEREEIHQAKRAVIEFNHAIRSIIDRSPSLTRQELLTRISDIAAHMVPNFLANDFRGNVRAVVVGMQQEIFTEQALWSIPDVEVDDEVSVEDELHGVDIRFHYKGKPYAIDVKSSPESVAEAEANSRQSDTNILFWTGLRGHEIGEAFRPNKEQEATIRERLMSLLEPGVTSATQVS